MRTFVYVDGFNLYYGVLKGTPWKWLDLPAPVREGPPVPSRYPDGQVFHGVHVGHARRSVEAVAPGRVSAHASALPA